MTDTHRASAGAVLGDRYRLTERIAVGGFAEVWRAVDGRLNRDVAVKLLSGTQARDPGQRVRIEREAMALASLSHPGVVAIFDYGEEPDPGGAPVPYLVMELVDGPDLAAGLHQGPMAPTEALDLTASILDAVARAHEIGIVHGDLKPANVLMSATGPKVGDFGVARIMGRETGATVPLGTPAYAPPEVLSGDRPTPSSDVYSAACIAVELATGRRPSPAAAPAALDEAPQIPERQREVLRQALDPDPARRFHSAGAFATALRGSADRPTGAGAPAAGDAVADPPGVVSADVASTQPLRREPTELIPRRARRRLAMPGLQVSLLAVLRRVPPGVMIAAVALLALVGAKGRADATVSVPRLLDLSVTQATAVAEQHRFALEAVVVEHGGRPDVVVEQDPPPGALRNAGSAIRVHVAKGAPQTTVPDVIGKLLDSAIAAVGEAKLVAADVAYVPNPDVAPGTVVKSVPPPRTEVDEGSEVQLIASAIPVQEPRAPPAGDDDDKDGDDRGKGKGKRD